MMILALGAGISLIVVANSMTDTDQDGGYYFFVVPGSDTYIWEGRYDHGNCTQARQDLEEKYTISHYTDDGENLIMDYYPVGDWCKDRSARSPMIHLIIVSGVPRT